MSSTKKILQKHRIAPLKHLGQNFLVNKSVAKRVILASKLKPSDIVLEIGPGTGVLTKELAKRVKKVIAVEKDRRMVDILEETLKGFKNIQVMQGDIRKIKLQITNYKPRTNSFGMVRGRQITNKLQITKNYKVVANLPFYLTAPVIRKFLESKNQPKLMVLVAQKEVAQRICSKPPRMNLLAASVQFYAKPKIISYIPKTAFWPQPKVDSAIIKIAPQINADKKQISADVFFKIVRCGFAHPRKQLVNNLSRGLKLDKQKTSDWLKLNNIKPTRRAETLTIKNWIALAKSCIVN